MEIQDIKARLTIHAVLKHYGLQPDRNGMLKCPFHPDDRPSMKIYPQTNTFNCFGCGKNGDAIEFIKEHEECSKHESLVKAAELCHGIKPTETQPINNKPMQNHTGIVAKIFSYFYNGLNKSAAKRPLEYLQSRKLNPELLEIGYNSGQFHHRGNLSETNKQACINAGLLIPYKGKTPNGSGNYTPFAKDCVIFPLKNKQNEVVSIYGRSISESSNSKHFYLKDRCGLYPSYPNPGTTKLILTEAIIDTASLLQIPEITAEYEILSCFGTNGFTEEHKAAIKELQRLEEIIFFFDGDKAGTEAIHKYREELLNELPGIKLTAIETPKGEDINSLSVAYDTEIFIHLLENRKSFLLTEQIEIQESEPQQEPVRTTGKLNTRNPEFITYTTEELQIIILGGINLQQLDRLRITVKISRTDPSTGSGQVHNPLHSIRHTLDLYHSDYLEKFINKASEQLETGTNVLKRAIAELTEQIEQYRLSKIESLKEQKPQARQLSEQRYRKAINYLKSLKLMERTNSDIGRTGMIGEENNRLLMYLVFTSRLREQPLHIISLGSSGTGKTHLQEKISELIPEQDKLEITILSENAFYYFDRKELKHKLVLIEDMDGAENVLYPLRELQSKRKISKTIPIKDSKGNLKTITMKVEGPICLAGTTTKEKLFEDNANRSLLIYLDNSKEHKEHIMNYQRKLSAGKIATKEEKQLIEFFKDMQTILKPIKVRNPFAEYLVIPEHVFKPLRTNSHYLAFIETITFYHQYQREVKTDATGESFIETTLEDIEWANLLLKEVLLAKADELPRAVRDFLERLKKWLQTHGKEIFYTKEIREEFRITSSSCNRYILELLRNNYIKVTGGNKYRQGFEYQVVRVNEYKELQQNIQTALDEALENIKQKLVSQYPTVSQNGNGVLKPNNTNVLSAVSQ
ncbi:MAG TPA: DNA primase [Marinilabiliales bacterium]|jgi:DNA primase catalytic core|nr:DNA primase [Marinilabiliales bacterium]